MQKGKKAVIGISAAVLTAGLGLGAVGIANAETPTPTPSPSASAQSGDHSGQAGRSHRGYGHGERGVRGNTNLSSLAEKLGVDEAKLKEAMKAARESAKSDKDTKLASALAKELGIAETKVTEAFEELRAERKADRQAADKAVLDQAVADGKLTQAEADAVLKASELGIVGIHGTKGR